MNFLGARDASVTYLQGFQIVRGNIVQWFPTNPRPNLRESRGYVSVMPTLKFDILLKMIAELLSFGDMFISYDR
jgi:hypothetical protein